MDENVVEASPPDQQGEEVNGFIFCGNTLPETVVELILTKVDDEDVLNCHSVCRAWSELIARKSLWKTRFDNKQVDWNSTLDRNGSWRVFHAILRDQILSKNYIKNSSGHDQFEGWTVVPNEYHQWSIEEKPVGCDPLPDLPHFGVKDRSAFIANSNWCSKYYLVDLWAEGLTPNLMKLLLPFQIKCCQSYTVRSDLGGDFDWELMLLNSQERVLSEYLSPITRLPQGYVKWRTAEYAFQFGKSNISNSNFLEELRYVLFIHEGKSSGTPPHGDRCGLKLSRSCVTIECLEPESGEEEPQTEMEKESTGFRKMAWRDRFFHIKERNFYQRLRHFDDVELINV
ncbi:F-box only protein 6 [Orchesella cincta]|uniref:F-box only protein 6 n=1 Tax=Orchesella cincta TaxID=48709 RepID=A0A1D2M8I7_ORCCI|nr:F-box only protein 6 [Orchesella cincta]